ncbi:unnamed protein product [Paramecium primaurelia]|uniref:Transmembrane protein n=1 Tax=Paramecium primaurelia TaxID=5886 RepID=A0A8S1NTH9_PARPR|nr:unnamed protein product [Paramecium primaurelia]
MNSNFVFLGLVHIQKDDQGQNQLKNIVKITEFSQDALKAYLQLPKLYDEKKQERGNNNWPFITNFATKPEYLIVLRRDANSVFLKQIRIEEFIIQNLPNDCSEQEWRNKATQILLTWNLAETNLKLTEENDKTSDNYAKYAQIYLILAVISFIVINILKHFI